MDDEGLSLFELKQRRGRYLDLRWVAVDNKDHELAEFLHQQILKLNEQISDMDEAATDDGT